LNGLEVRIDPISKEEVGFFNYSGIFAGGLKKERANASKGGDIL